VHGEDQDQECGPETNERVALSMADNVDTEEFKEKFYAHEQKRAKTNLKSAEAPCRLNQQELPPGSYQAVAPATGVFAPHNICCLPSILHIIARIALIQLMRTRLIPQMPAYLHNLRPDTHQGYNLICQMIRPTFGLPPLAEGAEARSGSAGGPRLHL